MDMKKQNLNEEVSRIKSMMGLTEARHDEYQEHAENVMRHWRGTQLADYQSVREILKNGGDGVINKIAEWVIDYYVKGSRMDSYVNLKDLGNDKVSLVFLDGCKFDYDDMEYDFDVEEEEFYEDQGYFFEYIISPKDVDPSDDQIMNQGNYEGGISGGGGSSWQGR